MSSSSFEVIDKSFTIHPFSTWVGALRELGLKPNCGLPKVLVHTKGVT